MIAEFLTRTLQISLRAPIEFEVVATAPQVGLTRSVREEEPMAAADSHCLDVRWRRRYANVSGPPIAHLGAARVRADH